MSIVLPPLSSPLPLELKQLIDRRIEAELALAARETAPEHGEESNGLVDRVQKLLERLVEDSERWLSTSGEAEKKVMARGRFVLAWSIGRLSEYDGKAEESLRVSLSHYAKAGELLGIPPPPALDSVPSVSRPRGTEKSIIKLPVQDAFVGEILAEYSRIQATYAFAVLLDPAPASDEGELSDLIDLAARRNVQALFTPLDESTVNPDDGENEEAGTVIGNARLLEDMASMRDWSPEPQLWKRRIDWATHICDVNFVAASMSANRLVESASTSTKILSSSKTGDAERREIRSVLEATIRRLVPFEVAQGKCLLKLGKTMLDCVRERYLGGVNLGRAEEEEEGEGVARVVVPEEELVTETRAILARSVQHLENAYTSFCRSPRTKSTNRPEQRMLRRIEAVYCLLEVLDNDVVAVVEQRTARIARAITINDRLAILGTAEGLEEDSEDDDDADDLDEELEEVEGRLAKELEKQNIE